MAAKARSYDEELVAPTLRALARRQASSGQTCAVCLEFKRLTAFPADIRTPNGLDKRCRACEAERQRNARRRRVPS